MKPYKEMTKQEKVDAICETFPEYKAASVSNLIPYARNSRTHSDAQVSKIAASIKEFGYCLLFSLVFSYNYYS